MKRKKAHRIKGKELECPCGKNQVDKKGGREE